MEKNWRKTTKITTNRNKNNSLGYKENNKDDFINKAKYQRDDE